MWGVILKPQPVRVLVWNTLIAHIPKIRVGSTYCESVCHLSAHVTAAPPEILGCGSIMCDIWVSLVFCFLPFSAFISFLPHSTELKGDDKIVISGESVHRAPFFIFHKLPFVALKNLLHGYHTFPPICFLVFICWLHCSQRVFFLIRVVVFQRTLWGPNNSFTHGLPGNTDVCGRHGEGWTFK